MSEKKNVLDLLPGLIKFFSRTASSFTKGTLLRGLQEGFLLIVVKLKPSPIG